MKLYSVTGPNDNVYYRSKKHAETYFDARVAASEASDDLELFDMYEVEIPISEATVLNLLNGQGGYIIKDTLLRSYEGKHLAFSTKA